jgi:hypothetical protein
MLVTNYAYAHKIVEKSPLLYWEGWDIVEFKPNPDAYFMLNGIFKNFRWGTKKVFKVTSEGWDVPNYYARG